MRSIDGFDGPIVVCRASSGEMPVAGICTHSRCVQLSTGPSSVTNSSVPTQWSVPVADGSLSRQPSRGLDLRGSDWTRTNGFDPSDQASGSTRLSDTPVPQVGTPLGRATPGLRKRGSRGARSCQTDRLPTTVSSAVSQTSVSAPLPVSAAAARRGRWAMPPRPGCQPAGEVNGNAHRCRASRPDLGEVTWPLGWAYCSAPR